MTGVVPVVEPAYTTKLDNATVAPELIEDAELAVEGLHMFVGHGPVSDSLNDNIVDDFLGRVPLNGRDDFELKIRPARKESATRFTKFYPGNIVQLSHIKISTLLIDLRYGRDE